MRKQYHLLPTQNGFDAWDVDKLIEASKDLPLVQVHLDDIEELDENFWYQGAGDIPTCRSIAEHAKLINEADLDYAVILSAERRVMDGMHRILKALNQGHRTIDAVIFRSTPLPDHRDIPIDDLPY
jgi:hypothetical protein